MILEAQFNFTPSITMPAAAAKIVAAAQHCTAPPGQRRPPPRSHARGIL